MKLLRTLKQLNLVKRNVDWWRGGHSFLYKLDYYFSVVASYTRLLLKREKMVRYLGRDLLFDNIATPLSLMYYPQEISEKILRNIDEPIESLLDVGGNIGQFILTFNHLSPKTAIDSLEPNPVIFEVFKKNTHNITNIKIYNYGVGPDKKQILHYSPSQSAIGSMLSANASTRASEESFEIVVSNSQDIGSLTGRSNYDLVKVDVEGYEYNVINNLKGLKTKYLFIEMSGLMRDKDAKSSEVFKAISATFGSFDIVNISDADRYSMNFDILLKF